MIGIVLVVSLVLLSACSAIQVEYDARALIIDGQRRIINAGAIHYPRSTTEMWPDLIKKAKEGGLDAIETYIFWDVHEPRRREYNFSGNLDFVKFFKLIQDAGLYGIIRIGPYVCAEWNFGGFPVWLQNTPGVQLRTDNEVFKNEMQIFTTKIVNMCKEANLFGPQGGPIILAQIENEYGNIMKKYGNAGKSYIQWCANMAVAQNISVPWIMCQQSDAPEPMINACNGFYCDQFKPNNRNYPKMWTENWTGWFKLWGGKDPYRPPEDLAFAVARFFQLGGVLNNYYMYHGGTNFERTAGGPYITTSYDYNAPLDEYGNLNQPKYGHLKQLHESLKVAEKFLTDGTMETKKNIVTHVDLTTYTIKETRERFCFLSSIDTSKDQTIDLGKDGKYFLPAWSVSLLQNCTKQIYNTAQVNTQTSVMVYKNSDESPSAHTKLAWMYKPENINDTLDGKGTFTAGKLLDQKEVTHDTSDYLWYMTKVNVTGPALYNARLRVRTSGHALQVYVNKQLVGYKFAKQASGQQSVDGDDYSFVFETPVTLSSGENVISLLSATVGLMNYGAFYETKPTGLSSGSVEIVKGKKTIMDLTTYQWSYKVGMDGEARRFYEDPDNESDANDWMSSDLQTYKTMMWYKTTFKTPSGTEPVVVDLIGMKKGHAWVNGNSIGRYWPSQIAENKGCSSECDYRGSYRDKKCRKNCGNPSQRWYHIPRSFLNKKGENKLILFEETGGNPSNVSIKIVTIGTVCGNAYEGNKLELSCQGGRKISKIEFASFGNHHSQEQCSSFKNDISQANNTNTNTFSVIEKACLGQTNCTVDNTNDGKSRLTVQAICEMQSKNYELTGEQAKKIYNLYDLFLA